MARRRRPTRKPEEEGVLRAEDLARKAEAYALDLLALRQRTVRELATRLRSKGYGEEIISGILERAQRAGYLDDRKFALTWVEDRSLSYPCGPARLRVELGQKGVDSETASAVLAENLPPERETRLAVGVARKRVRPLRDGEERARSGEESEAAKEKVWNFLRRRGFGARACQEALQAAFGPQDDLPEAEEDPADIP